MLEFEKYEEINILDIIPQRPPMMMIDKVINMENNGEKGNGIKTIPGDSPFSFDRQAPKVLLIEMIAQLVAAINGIDYKKHSDEKVPEGYLVAIKSFSIYGKLPIDKRLNIEVQRVSKLDNITVYHGKVYKEQNLLAEGDLKFYLNT